MHDDVFQELIQLFSKLPGIGPKSASRRVLFLLKNKEKLMLPLSRSLLASAESIKKCSICGNLGVNLPCKVCNNPKRNKSIGLASLILSVIELCNILCYELSAFLVYVNIYILKSPDYILDMFNTVFKY